MKKGFTLSEILMSLAVLGVIAMLTMPGLITNSSKKSLKAAQEIEKKHMIEAINTMRLKNDLSASTNEEFADKLQKYLKVSKRCTAANITQCFASSFQVTDGTVIQTNTLTTGVKLGQSNSTSPIAGMVLANGTTVILAFDPACNDTVDEFKGDDNLTTCLSILYDVNGFKGPNQFSAGPYAEDGQDIEDGKDILTQNVLISDCDGTKIGALCFAAADTAFSPVNEAPSTGPYNYWAGAKAACAAVGMRLPDKTELDIIYQNKATISGLNLSALYWSSTEDGGGWNGWLERMSDGHYFSDDKEMPGYKARCVK